jgi:hypothetical protein
MAGVASGSRRALAQGDVIMEVSFIAPLSFVHKLIISSQTVDHITKVSCPYTDVAFN